VPCIPPSLIPSIHASGRRLVIAVTGGGSGAIAALLQTPGASRTVLEAVVPYSDAALEAWLGGAPDQSCSDPTARAMAMAAFMRARRLAPDFDPRRLLGVACTASLATDRPKRGEHRIHVAVQTAGETASHSLLPEKGRRDRAAEERLATKLTIWALATSCGVDAKAIRESIVVDCGADAIDAQRHQASQALTDLLLGSRRRVIVDPRTHIEPRGEAASLAPSVVFPGAFNPPHVGHRRMAAEAERRLGGTVAWEISIANVDKPPLDFISIHERVEALRSEDDKRLVVLTWAATFREKAELFPGAAFVVGADTITRIANPHYYGGDPRRRDEAISQIAAQGCRFLVFGRQFDHRFQVLEDLELPRPLRDLCDGVPATEFREDVASTELRTPDGV
jgi:nicotinamide mononucleotide (NMN) deamidase PncC